MIGLGPDFTKLWLAQAVSNVGDGVHVTALPLVAASLTRDPLSVSAVWRLETFKFSTDPGLEAKVRGVVGLYLDPQERAIVSAWTRRARSRTCQTMSTSHLNS